MGSSQSQPSGAPKSAATHTPGPWEWDCGVVPPDGPGRYSDIYVDGGDLIIAHFNDQIPEGLANARLIAAAPDLLEVCLAFISKIGREGYYPTAGEPLTRKMRTAILKATGQEAPAFGDGSSRTATKANSGLNTINEVSQ